MTDTPSSAPDPRIAPMATTAPARISQRSHSAGFIRASASASIRANASAISQNPTDGATRAKVLSGGVRCVAAAPKVSSTASNATAPAPRRSAGGQRRQPATSTAAKATVRISPWGRAAVRDNPSPSTMRFGLNCTSGRASPARPITANSRPGRSSRARISPESPLGSGGRARRWRRVHRRSGCGRSAPAGSQGPATRRSAPGCRGSPDAPQEPRRG